MGKMRGWCWCLGLVMSIVVILAECNVDLSSASLQQKTCPSEAKSSEGPSLLLQKEKLLCCKIFFSESRNRTALDVIEKAARNKNNSETVIVSKFMDIEYNRVRFTLVSYINKDEQGNRWTPLYQTVQNMVDTAIGAINLTLHEGLYPRLGVVDDILVHPLANATMEDAVWLAEELAKYIGQESQVPVYLYDEAHREKKDSYIVRKNLGYFKLNTKKTQPNMTKYVPDKGEAENFSPERGIATIGARPWVDYYNIPILSTNLSVVEKIAAGVREREKKQTGHRNVKTLGLVHGDDGEILCMLYEPKTIGTDQVQDWVEKLAAKEGLAIQKGYFTDFPEERAIEIYNNFKSPDQSNTIIEQLTVSTNFQYASGVMRITTLDPRIGRINLVLELPEKEIHLTIMIPQWTRQEHFFS